MARPKILIAEADKDLLDIYQIVIESEFDCELLIAQTGDKAIELLNNFDDIACIISDYKMPNRNGGDLFQANLKK